MKIFNLLIVLILSTAVVGHAQEADRLMKKARKALGTYNLDQNANSDKLDEAISQITEAMADTSMSRSVDGWLAKGQIMLEAANRDYTRKLLSGAEASHPDAASQSFDAFKQAAQYASKKYEKKDAISGIASVIGLLNNQAINAYQAEENGEAFKNFSAVIEAHDILVAEGEKSPLENKQVQDAKFSAAVTGMSAGQRDQALKYLNELVEAKYPNAYIYDLMYNAWIDTDKVKAVGYLDTGRKLFPEEVTLLFTEINHYLREGRMDELVGKLKTAIEKEPENKSLYLTLGNVYDNLFQKEMEAKNSAQADTHFNNALDYYQQALAKDENYTDAIYSIGALYYNKAAVYTQELTKLADDYSKDGLKKYDAMKDKVNAEFDKALPYFQKAEKIDPNDQNTLIALKEIYARKNDLELSTEFKNRLDKVMNGESNPTSYFK